MAKDVLKAVRLVLVNKTSAADRVGTRLKDRIGPDGKPLPLSEIFPAIRYRLNGREQVSQDNRVKGRRVTFHVYGRQGAEGHAEASRCQMELEDVLLPPERVVHGYKGWQGDVYISDVRPDSGPSEEPDPDTGEARYISSYKFIYY